MNTLPSRHFETLRRWTAARGVASCLISKARWLPATVVLTMGSMSPTIARAERGWACIEEQGLIQKYKIDGQTMVAEGDAFTRMLEANAKKLGEAYKPMFVWHIVVNNENGLIALNALAGKRKGADSEVFVDTLMIEKDTGRYRHIRGAVDGRLTDIEGGSCTDY